MCFRKTIRKCESVNLQIANDDIISYKLLLMDTVSNNIWKTPYMNQNIFFVDGIAIQEVKELAGWINDYSLHYYENDLEPHRLMNFVVEENNKDSDILHINKGIHSCSTAMQAQTIGFITFGIVYNIFLCVIPKGSRFLKNDNGDFVSDKLIIFETYADYEKYKENEYKLYYD